MGSVEREGSELSDTTLTVTGDDGKLSGVARLERGQTSATFEQNLHAEVRPVPYDNRVTQHRLHTRHGWVSYYEGETPEPVADITTGRSAIDLVHYLALFERT